MERELSIDISQMDASRPLAQLNPEKSGFFYVYTSEPTSTQKDVNSEGFFARESSRLEKDVTTYLSLES